jgi:hypothetical protein
MIDMEDEVGMVKVMWTKRSGIEEKAYYCPNTLSKGFAVYSDVSKKKLTCVLLQHEKVIAYVLRQLKPY